MINRLVYTGNT